MLADVYDKETSLLNYEVNVPIKILPLMICG